MAKKQLGQTEKIYDQLTKYFSLIIFFLIILVLAIFYFILIEPKLQTTVAQIQEGIRFQENVYNVERRTLAQMQDNLNFYREMKADDLALLAEVIPNPYPKEKLFGEIEDIVLQHGFTLTSLSIADRGSTDRAGETSQKRQLINISLELAGIDYIAMKRFLPILENHLPLMDIVYLNFSPDGENLSLTINTYYFNP